MKYKRTTLFLGSEFPYPLLYPLYKKNKEKNQVEEISINGDSLMKIRKIGEGNFGDVWYGKFPINFRNNIFYYFH